MFVSFYLLNRSDDVDVYIVNNDGMIVRTLASGVHMQGGRHPERHTFTWDGRLADGTVAPDGNYFVRVSLVHQGRTVLISNSSGPEPVTVETVPPRPKVTGVTPSLIPQPSSSGSEVTIHYAGTKGLNARVLIYRTDLPGRPVLVKSFSSGRRTTTHWDGTIKGRPAHAGSYLIGLKVTDRACNTGRFPPELPPVPGSTRHAGVTVRYLAAEPPLTAVPAGSKAIVYVDSRRHPYQWTLYRAAAGGGPGAKVAAGSSTGFQLEVPVPAGGPGLYELSLHLGSHHTIVPLVAAAAHAAHPRMLVVMPALTWQGRNPVDDTGDGIPDTLSAGDPIALHRPLADGLPAGFADLTGLLAYLKSAHLPFDLTTDVELTDGVGSALPSARGVVFAGDEPWVPVPLAQALRSYAAGGGHVMSLGIDSLRRLVRLSANQVSAPTAPGATDVLGARPGALVASHGALILTGRDRLHIFTGTSGALRGYPSYQRFAPTTSYGAVASAAGATTAAPSIIGYRLSKGIVIDIGLPGFGSSLARNLDARQLVSSVWRVISGR
jgi:hypothetical protein